MAISAIYQHHERTTLAALEADLQLREIGIDPENAYLVAYSEALATTIYAPTNASTQVDFSAATVVALAFNGGSLVTVGAITAGGAISSVGNFSVNTNKFTVAASSGNTLVAGTLGVTGLMTATAGLSVPDGAGMSSTITFARTMIARSGTTLAIGDADGWTGSNIKINSGNFDWYHNATNTMRLASSGLTVTGAVTAGAASSHAQNLLVNGYMEILNDAGNSAEIELTTTGGTGSPKQWRILSLGSVQSSIGDIGSIVFRNQTDAVSALHLSAAGAVTIPTLAGTGTRLTTSTSTGVQGNATTIAGAYTWSGASQTFSSAPTFSSLSAGRMALVSTGGLIAQDSIYWATGGFLGIGAGASTIAITLAADLLINKSSSSLVSATVVNTNTGSAADARLAIATGATTAGDPYILFNVSGGDSWTFGIDNSDSDACVLTSSATLGSSNIQRWTSAGSGITGSLQVSGDAQIAGKIGVGPFSPTADVDATFSRAGDVTIGVYNLGAGRGVFAIQATGGGDALFSFETAAGSWSGGIDSSASDAFKISKSSSLGTNDMLTITTAGAVGIPGALTVGGALATLYTATGSNITAGVHHIIELTGSTTRDFTLPLASSCPGRQYLFIARSTSGGTIVPVRSGSDTMNGVTTWGGTSFTGGLLCVSDGVSNWIILNMGLAAP